MAAQWEEIGNHPNYRFEPTRPENIFRESGSRYVKRNDKSLIQALKFLRRQSTDKIGESGLWKTHQFIAMDAALVFHALFNSN